MGAGYRYSYLSREAGLAKFDLREYARRGAEVRAAELNAELDEIYRAFPELHSRRRRSQSATSAEDAGVSRRRRTMTAAQRREVSLRMKRYWAGRRKAAAAK